MHDTTPQASDWRCLFEVASSQHGFFTASQAKACGYPTSGTTRLAQTGRIHRVKHGVYRLRDYPSYPREDVLVAWLKVGPESAVVSHDTALELLDLSDLIPKRIHLTVPRSKRYVRSEAGIVIHTSTESIDPLDVTVIDGISVTSATRSIIDAADGGAMWDQIEMAVTEALDRGMTTPNRLLESASRSKPEIQSLIERTVTATRP